MGEILFTSFESLETMDISKYDIKLQITLYTNKGLYSDFIQVPQLAPSKELFAKTMYRWKKVRFTKDEWKYMSEGTTGTWFDLYTRDFLYETSKRCDFKKAYNRLKEHLNNGKNIIAICYCSDYNYCHRSIIANMLIKDGYKVILN